MKAKLKHFSKYFALSVCANLLIASAVGFESSASPGISQTFKISLQAYQKAGSAARVVRKDPAPANSLNFVSRSDAANSFSKSGSDLSETSGAQSAQKRDMPEVAARDSVLSAGSGSGEHSAQTVYKAIYRLQAPPVYPEKSLYFRHQGKVVLHVLVSPDGSPVRLKVAESSGYRLLDMSALSAVKKWEFETDGARARKWVRVPVRFVIKERIAGMDG